jgi:hypothetical protein
MPLQKYTLWQENVLRLMRVSSDCTIPGLLSGQKLGNDAKDLPGTSTSDVGDPSRM